ncbi:YkuS family protein [Desulfolucanica intricata]|uniref:YkuS family protein n=1 Tax=Desulfolucanica intricata TaxID=1285191 RepID=UPI00082B48C9|nr:YkuS family protein [Desulfolucanica intricata]
MNKKTVAVEDGLTEIKETLQKEGYKVVTPSQAQSAAVIVTTGLDNNVMNMQDITTKAPVVNASGKTTQEVFKEIKQFT